jgi:hypothetical protein
VKWTAIAKSHNRKWMWRRPVLQVAFSEGDETRIFGVSVGRREQAEPWKAAIDRLVPSVASS